MDLISNSESNEMTSWNAVWLQVVERFYVTAADCNQWTSWRVSRAFYFFIFFQTVNDLKSRITIYALVWFGQPFGWLDEEKKHNITLKALQLSLINCLYELIWWNDITRKGCALRDCWEITNVCAFQHGDFECAS